MIRRLRLKFILIAMVSLFAVLAITMTTINVLNYRGLIESADETIELLENIGGVAPQNRPPHSVTPNEDGMFNSMTPMDIRYMSVVYNSEGYVLSIVKGNTSLTSDEILTLSEAAYNKGGEWDFYGNYRYHIRFTKDTIQVTLLDCTRVLNTYTDFLWTSIIISAAGLIAVFVLIFILSGIIVKPIAKSIEKQKSFITDAGHELKTPITVIDADAELIELDYGENEWLTDIKKQTKRLATLTKDLIYLSRMEEDGFKLNAFEFPISDIVGERAASFTAIAKTNGKSIKTDIEPMLSYKGDEKSVSQLVSLLIDNAIKYSASEDTIEVSLSKHNRYMILRVSNLAPGVSRDDLDKFFDRFYRGDKSRSAEGGYGLGLSVAKAIVLSHKGKITASLTEKGRLEITSLLPI
ncbi:MAG: HAMP domain-containing histidine kinase [Clostridia bacterium]|nr:HAMP domain-containing histidine kinase [Clostridia bacterium]